MKRQYNSTNANCRIFEVEDSALTRAGFEHLKTGYAGDVDSWMSTLRFTCSSIVVEYDASDEDYGFTISATDTKDIIRTRQVIQKLIQGKLEEVVLKGIEA